MKRTLDELKGKRFENKRVLVERNWWNERA